MNLPEYEAESAFYLGLIRRSQQQLDQAYKLLRRARELHPEVLHYALEFAVVCEWRGRLEEAWQVYQAVLEQDAESFPAQLGLARLAHWRGYMADALRRYDLLLQRDPENTAVNNGKARALMADYQLAAAETLFKRVLALNPNDPEAGEGLEQLRKVRRHSLEAGVGWISNPNESVLRYYFNFSRQESQALSWGLSALINETELTDIPSSGIVENRAIKADYSSFLSYRASYRQSYLISYHFQTLADQRTQHQAQLEASFKLQDDRYYLGSIPKLLDGQLINALNYAGYDFKLKNAKTLGAQVFYSYDLEFPDSTAFSLSLSGAWLEKNSFRLGSSLGLTDGEADLTAYLESMVYLSKDVALNLSLVNNFDRNTRNFKLGVRYEF